MLTQLMFHLVFPETILNLVVCAPKVGKKMIYSCTTKTKKLSLRLKLDSNVI